MSGPRSLFPLHPDLMGETNPSPLPGGLPSRHPCELEQEGSATQDSQPAFQHGEAPFGDRAGERPRSSQRSCPALICLQGPHVPDRWVCGMDPTANEKHKKS